MIPRLARVVALALVTWSGVASAEQASRASVDRVAVRFFTPETGGSARPRYVSERVLGFEARLEALSQEGPGANPYEDRFVRAALDVHVAEEMLAALAVEAGTDPMNMPTLVEAHRTALTDRVGGAQLLHAAMDAEGISDAEVDAMVRRRVRATYYVDRALTPIMRSTDEQIHEVYRTSSHPYKGLSFDDARERLRVWFVQERLKTAEQTFLQSARARIRVVVVPR